MSVVTKVRALAARATMSAEDVRALLQKDHDEALALAKKMHEARQGNTRRALLAKLKPALVAHSRAEEKQVYNALLSLKKSQPSHDIGNEGFVEHGLLDELLTALQRGDASTDMWKAQAKVLYELLDHHVSEEKSDMFVDLGEHFSSEELIVMGQKFLRAKVSVLAKIQARKA